LLIKRKNLVNHAQLTFGRRRSVGSFWMGQALVRTQVASVEDFSADLAPYNLGHDAFDGRGCLPVTGNHYAVSRQACSGQRASVAILYPLLHLCTHVVDTLLNSFGNNARADATVFTSWRSTPVFFSKQSSQNIWRGFFFRKS
jgi:hypothetical protein